MDRGSRHSAQSPAGAVRPDIVGALMTRGVLTATNAAQVRLSAVEVGRPPEFVVIELGLASEAEVMAILSDISGVPVWRLEAGAPDPALASGVRRQFLMTHLVAPVARRGDRIAVAMADPFDADCRAALEFSLGCAIEPLLASPTDIRATLDLVSLASHTEDQTVKPVQRDISTLADAVRSSPTALTLQALLALAIDRRASDIHLEPRARHAQIRLRIDGMLLDVEPMTLDAATSIMARIKVLADLNVAESRMPQDGRLSVAVRGTPIDVRVATTPSVHGEAITLRLLNRAGALRTVDSLGLGAHEKLVLQRAFAARHGLFLVSGPTGSGKTTTLYAGLEQLKGKGLKILSIEDPIELQFDHVLQIQVAPQIGLTFSAALRSVLRHDPDVIMVGEIRDAETAKIAIQAALTGHLVVASIHARDALRACTRLLEMGVEPYQLSAALIGSMAQRLVRSLCAACSEIVAPSAELLALGKNMGAPPAHASWLAGRGCGACAGGGYAGRIPVAEGLLVSEALTSAIARSDSLEAQEHIAAASGYRPLRYDALEKAAAGRTSLEEAVTAIGDH